MKTAIVRNVALVLSFIVLGPGTASTPAHSQARVDSLKLTCQQANALVRQRGKVLLSTGPRKFDLVVRSKSFCPVGETARSYRTQTADKRSCQVGKVCRGFTRFGD